MSNPLNFKADGTVDWLQEPGDVYIATILGRNVKVQSSWAFVGVSC